MQSKLKLATILFGAIILSLAAYAGTVSASNNQPAQSEWLYLALPPTQATAEPTAANGSPTAVPTSANNAPASAPAAADNAPASGSGAWDLITNAMLAQASSKSFRTTNVTTSAAGTTTIIVEFVSPDRMHMTTTLASGKKSEMISIKGQNSWQKINDKWVPVGADLGAIAFEFLDPKNIDQLKSAVDLGTVQLVGAELLGTTPTLVYQFDEAIKGAGAGGGDFTGSYKVWIGATDHRIYKQEGDSESMITPGAKDHSVSTVEYDIDIKIEPPA